MATPEKDYADAVASGHIAADDADAAKAAAADAKEESGDKGGKA